MIVNSGWQEFLPMVEMTSVGWLASSTSFRQQVTLSPHHLFTVSPTLAASVPNPHTNQRQQTWHQEDADQL